MTKAILGKFVADTSCLTLAAILSTCCPSPALAGNSDALPPGNYVYLGEGPNTQAPRRFSIGANGIVIWKTLRNRAADANDTHDGLPEQRESRSNRQSSQDGQQESEGASLSPSQKQDNNPFEKYDFPTIKWKARAVKGKPNAVAQLLTTVGPRPGSGYPEEMIKARLTLLKVRPTLLLGLYQTVTLFDSNGFKIATLAFNEFKKTPGTELYQGESMVPRMNVNYENAVDYTVE